MCARADKISNSKPFVGMWVVWAVWFSGAEGNLILAADIFMSTAVGRKVMVQPTGRMSVAANGADECQCRCTRWGPPPVCGLSTSWFGEGVDPFPSIPISIPTPQFPSSPHSACRSISVGKWVTIHDRA